jgi:SpoVK/Ycf46/Vps4 family AAA+-type ATPase
MPLDWKRLDEAENQNIFSTEISAATATETKASELDRLANFVPQVPIRDLKDVILPGHVAKGIEGALNRIRYHDKLYNEWNLKKIDPSGRRVAINFFGPPGTGKTFCAEAIAKHLGKNIIIVNYAEIESKYVGETPKNVTAAFKQAQATDSVLFFDEADSILGKRMTNVTQSADHGVNVSRSVMLLQLDSFDGIVVFASNLPENYDGAFVRRILAHIEFELPDEDCLIRLWETLLPFEVPRVAEVTPVWLAAESVGLAGGDILNVVKLAASQAVSRAGEDCKVSQSDIQEAISQVRAGKEKVGGSSEGRSAIPTKPISVKETILTPDELSPEIRQRYDNAVDQKHEARLEQGQEV